MTLTSREKWGTPAVARNISVASRLIASRNKITDSCRALVSLFAFREIVVNERNEGTRRLNTKQFFDGLFTSLGANPIEALKFLQRKVFRGFARATFPAD